MCDNNLDMENIYKDILPSRGLFGLYESFKDDEEYNNSKCLSYSRIKYAYEDPQSLFKDRDSSEKEWFTFGTLVDIITNPNIKLEDKVLVNNKVPSEQFKKMSEYIMENNITTDLSELSDEDINKIYEESGSKERWLIDTKKKKLISECSDYIKLLIDNREKIIVTTDIFNEAVMMAELIKSHRWSKNLFLSESQQEKDQIELYYQYKIKYLFENMQCKSKLDIIKIDHDLKLISPYDIKTGTDLPIVFVRDALFKYRYCYQGCLYREGLEAFIKKTDTFKDYSIDVFRFVYISRLRPDYPIILQMSDSFHNEVRTLGVETDNYVIPSLEETFEAIDYYFKQIDLGEIPTEPYYLIGTEGEQVMKSTINSSRPFS
jgi:hypothetical protein